MKRFTQQFLLTVVALAMTLPAWAQDQGVHDLPQPGLPMIYRPGPTSSSFLLSTNTAVAVGWQQLRTFRNITISLQSSKGQYHAYLTKNLGPQASLIAEADGPPANGVPLFQVAEMNPGNYYIVVVRRGPETQEANWDLSKKAFVPGAAIFQHLTQQATYTSGNPYQAMFTTFDARNGLPRFYITAQWTHDPSVAYGPPFWGAVGAPADICGFRPGAQQLFSQFGKSQSPINIDVAQTRPNTKQTLTFNYGTSLPLVVANLGYTIEVPKTGNTGFHLTFS